MSKSTAAPVTALAVRTERLKEFEERQQALAPAIRSLRIATAQDRQIASELNLRATGLLREIDGDFEPIIGNAYSVHKSLKALHTKYRGVVLELRGVLDREVVRDRNAQNELAERERARIAQQQSDAEEERRIARAIEAEEAGEKELADQILEEEAPPVVAPVAAIEKVAGLSVRHNFDYTLVDVAAVKPIAEVMELLGRIQARAGAVANGEAAGGEEKKRACADIVRWAAEARTLILGAREGERLGFLCADSKEIGKMVRASGKKAEQIIGGIVVSVIETVSH